jgi:hypothetical protein
MSERRQLRAHFAAAGPQTLTEKVGDSGGGSTAEVVDGEELPVVGGLLPGVLQLHTR